MLEELERERGVTMQPAIATLYTKFKGKKKPNKVATASLKMDKVAMAKINQGRKEKKTYSWDDEVFGD